MINYFLNRAEEREREEKKKKKAPLQTETYIKKKFRWGCKALEYEKITFTVLNCKPDNFDVANTKNIELTLYDGCVNILERWDLKDIKKTSLMWNGEDVEWTATYENCCYHQIC